MELSAAAIRVLGSLMEKARTTPENYPLTLNALVNACNQKTSREPVTDYDEDEVLDALEELRGLRLAMRVDMAGSRTAKFRENATREWVLERQEYALLAVLMLRGPQTPGQLRQRSERLYPFADLIQVGDWLNRLQAREEEPLCLVQSLGRAPGTKEIRWAHTLSGEVEAIPEEKPDMPWQTPAPAEKAPEGAPSMREMAERLDRVESRLEELESLLNELTS